MTGRCTKSRIGLQHRRTSQGIRNITISWPTRTLCVIQYDSTAIVIFAEMSPAFILKHKFQSIWIAVQFHALILMVFDPLATDVKRQNIQIAIPFHIYQRRNVAVGNVQVVVIADVICFETLFKQLPLQASTGIAYISVNSHSTGTITKKVVFTVLVIIGQRSPVTKIFRKKRGSVV